MNEFYYGTVAVVVVVVGKMCDRYSHRPTVHTAGKFIYGLFSSRKQILKRYK